MLAFSEVICISGILLPGLGSWFLNVDHSVLVGTKPFLLSISQEAAGQGSYHRMDLDGIFVVP